MRREHPFDSDASRVAQALASVLRGLVKPVQASFVYDDGSLDMLLARKRHWNRLLGIAEPWEDADGYDRARWTYLYYPDAAEEEAGEYNRQREEEQAAYERERLLRSL